MSPVPRPRPRTWMTAASAALLLAGCSTEKPDIEVATSSEPTTTTTASDTPGAEATSTEAASGPSSSTLTATPTEEGATAFITIGPDSVTPIAEKVDLSVDAPLTLDITSSRSAELHASSSPEKVVEVEPGHSTVDLTFDEAGSYDVYEPESDSLILRVLVH